MTILMKHFNIRDYFDLRSAQLGTIAKFRYIERLLCLLITHLGTKMTNKK